MDRLISPRRLDTLAFAGGPPKSSLEFRSSLGVDVVDRCKDEGVKVRIVVKGLFIDEESAFCKVYIVSLWYNAPVFDSISSKRAGRVQGDLSV